jgi:hypothetical protein
MAGYSGRPLFQKLGLKEGMKAARIGAPDGYLELLGEGAPDLDWHRTPFQGCDFAHVFSKDREELSTQVASLRGLMAPNGMIWASWPKKASQVPTNVTEDVIREIALPLGLVDVKVCAVDPVWSGLKLVIRKELR